ncbi:response regulator, partial [Candidatus Poribacteria bacterium]|nr:response regulator [Candidatus Poribacteria bacterium]
TETVLFVEDEPSLLRLGRKLLERLGYSVVAAGTPAQAIELARQYPGDIPLLITDVVMPGMNGLALWEHLRSMRPAIKCLFMSGYTADVIAHHSMLDEGVHFLQKPFTQSQLSAKVREVLDA